MRILHTSDLHLGIMLHECSLLDEQHAMINTLIDIVRENDVDVAIIAGDIFDRALVPQSALQLYDILVTRLCVELEVPTIICAGNHDAPDRLALCNKMLAKSSLFVEGRVSRDIKPVIIKNCAFYMIPHFNTETVRALFPEENIENYQAAYKLVCDKIRSEMDEKLVNIVVGHCYVAGGVLSESDRSARLGGSEIIPASVFDGFDYVALGHLHAPYNVTPSIRYSGTPLKYSFGEKGNTKSVSIFDSESKDIFTINFPFVKDLREISGTFLELLELAESDVKKDDYMKIVVTDRYPTGDIYELFKKLYSYILKFEGMAIRSETSMSTLTAGEIVKLSPLELLKDYYSNKDDVELSEFELEWFEKALIAVKGEVDKQ